MAHDALSSLLKATFLALLSVVSLVRGVQPTRRSWTKNTFPLLDSPDCSFIAREIRMNRVRNHLSGVNARSSDSAVGNATIDRKQNFVHICDPDHLWNEDRETPQCRRAMRADHRAINSQLADVSALSTCSCFDHRRCGRHPDEYGYAVYVAVMEYMGSDTPRGIGEPPLHESFAETLAARWDIGHCSDYILVVIIVDWDRVVLHHGDWTEVHKIPDEVKRAMQSQANQMLLFTNSTNVIDYLIVNYRAVLQISANETATLSLLILPYQDLSTGVITVMLLTCVLAVGWTVCLAYLAVLITKRRRNPTLIMSSTTRTSSSTRAKAGVPQVVKRPPPSGESPGSNRRVVEWMASAKETEWGDVNIDPPTPL